MKRISALICAALFVCVALCGCSAMDNAVNDVKDKASEAVSDAKRSASEYSGDNNGLFDDNRATSAPTTETEYASEATEPYPTDDDTIGEGIDEMIENGEVEDGDGNIGDLENRDGDANVDENAAEYAQEQVSPDDDAVYYDDNYDDYYED